MNNKKIERDPLKVFARTPGRLQKLVSGLSKKQLRYRPAPRKWSIIEIVSHLADTELVLAFRFRMALAQSGTPLQATNQDKWANLLRYQQSDVREQIDLFSSVRKRNLALLRSLSEDKWLRFGIHEERGKETVGRMAQLYAAHDINHMSQVEAIRKLLKAKRT
jgi:hypothetical protein